MFLNSETLRNSHALDLHGVVSSSDHEALHRAQDLHHLPPGDGLPAVGRRLGLRGDVSDVLKRGRI